jgi:hypothetical protein
MKLSSKKQLRRFSYGQKATTTATEEPKSEKPDAKSVIAKISTEQQKAKVASFSEPYLLTQFLRKLGFLLS